MAKVQSIFQLNIGVGEDAWIDHAFNTTDVFLLMDTVKMSAKHREFYTRKRARDA